MSTVKTLFFYGNGISPWQEPDEILLVGPPEIGKNIGLGTYGPVLRPRTPLF